MVVKIDKVKQTGQIQECLINLPGGMLGFKDYKQFVLIESEEYAPFKCLQSIDAPQIKFLMINPVDFFPKYDIELSELDTEELDIKDTHDVKIVTTVTVDRTDGWMTTNLMGPVVINTRSLVGKQIVLDRDTYGTKHIIGNQSYYQAAQEQRVAV